MNKVHTVIQKSSDISKDVWDKMESEKVVQGVNLCPTEYNFEQFKKKPEALYKAKMK